ncbi:MAG: hypothetical protein WCJ34_10990 [Alcaligenaceae bacterium]
MNAIRLLTPGRWDSCQFDFGQSTTGGSHLGFFIKEGASPSPISPEAFAEHLDTELKRWKLVAQAADIQPE